MQNRINLDCKDCLSITVSYCPSAHTVLFASIQRNYVFHAMDKAPVPLIRLPTDCEVSFKPYLTFTASVLCQENTLQCLIILQFVFLELFWIAEFVLCYKSLHIFIWVMLVSFCFPPVYQFYCCCLNFLDGSQRWCSECTCK